MSEHAEKSKTVDQMRSKFKNYTCTAHANIDFLDFIAAGLYYGPAFYSNSSTILFFWIINALLIEIGVNIDPSNVATSWPGEHTLA